MWGVLQGLQLVSDHNSLVPLALPSAARGWVWAQTHKQSPKNHEEGSPGDRSRGEGEAGPEAAGQRSPGLLGTGCPAERPPKPRSPFPRRGLQCQSCHASRWRISFVGAGRLCGKCLPPPTGPSPPLSVLTFSNSSLREVGDTVAESHSRVLPPPRYLTQWGGEGAWLGLCWGAGSACGISEWRPQRNSRQLQLH